MAVVARKYLPGYTGVATIDTHDQPIQGWSSDHDPGLWDASTGAWMHQEAGMQKITFTFTVMVTLTSNVAGFPTFAAGQTVAAVFKINGVAAYQGNVIITKFSPKNDLKGGCTIDVTADSQDAMTGTMVPTDLVYVPPSGS